MIGALFGPQIHVFHPSDGGFGIVIPVTFVNAGSRMGVTNRCALTLRYHVDKRWYKFEWESFRSYKDVGDKPGKRLDFEQVAGPVALQGRSSTTKLVRFLWHADSQAPLTLQEGSYELGTYAWTRRGERPDRASKHTFTVSAAQATELARRNVARVSDVLTFVLDPAAAENQVLSEDEYRQLFGPVP